MPRPASGHGAAKSLSSSIVAAEHNVNMPIPNSAVGSAALLATITDLQIPHFLAPVITSATRATRDRLIIILFSRLFDAPSPDAARRNSTGSTGTNKSSSGISHTTKWDEVQRLLTYVYVQATKVAQDMDKVLLDIDVLLRGMDDDLEEDVATGVEMVFRIEGDCIPTPLPQSIASLRTSWHIPGEQTSETQHAPLSPTLSPTFDEEPSTLPVVAVGGTFDHLHAGHKILLSMAAWITEEKLIVGVTDESLLQKKANKHVLESLETRMRRVRQFLELFKPGLIYDIVPINDVYGPTGWDPNIQALVVSQETLSGGEAIDRHRKERSLPPLRTFVIDVISHSSARLDEEDLELMRQTKMSSTFIREWIVKHQRNIDKGVTGRE